MRFYLSSVFIRNKIIYFTDIQFATGFVLRGGRSGVVGVVNRYGLDRRRIESR